MSDPTPTPDERAAFEAWARKHELELTEWRDEYESNYTNGAWHGWQGRASIAAPPVQAPAEPAQEFYLGGPYQDGTYSICEVDTFRVRHKFNPATDDHHVEGDKYQSRGVNTSNGAATVAAPPGWKMVPVEPTPDMLYAMAECDGYQRGDRDHPMLTQWEDYWRMAMSAAPVECPECGPVTKCHGHNDCPVAASQAGIIARLRSLRVVLGIDNPETRGWAPAVQQSARRVIDAAIAALAASPAPAAAEDARDAKRYRWLRDKGEYFLHPVPQGTDPIPSPWAVIGVDGMDCRPCSREELDAAIDAAIAAQAGGKTE